MTGESGDVSITFTVAAGYQLVALCAKTGPDTSSSDWSINGTLPITGPATVTLTRRRHRQRALSHHVRYEGRIRQDHRRQGHHPDEALGFVLSRSRVRTPLRSRTRVPPKELTLAPGSYDVTEGVLPWYWVLDSLVCTVTKPDGGTSSTINLAAQKTSITLGAGGEVRCAFTNEKRGRVIVKKLTDQASTDAFPFTIAGPNSVNLSFGLKNGERRDKPRRSSPDPATASPRASRTCPAGRTTSPSARRARPSSARRASRSARWTL